MAGMFDKFTNHHNFPVPIIILPNVQKDHYFILVITFKIFTVREQEMLMSYGWKVEHT